MRSAFSEYKGDTILLQLDSVPNVMKVAVHSHLTIDRCRCFIYQIAWPEFCKEMGVIN